MDRTPCILLFASIAALVACQPVGPRQTSYSPQPAIDCQKPAAPPASSGKNGITPTGQTSHLLANYGVTYEVEMKPVLARCTGCHGNAGGVSLATYDQAKANGAASLAAVRAKRMPPSGPLAPADIATFEQWAAGGYASSNAGGGGAGGSSSGGTSGGGANGGTTSTTLPPDNGAVIYEDQIRPLFATYCQPCHTAAANRATFDTYDDVRRSFATVLARISLASTDPKRMPKGKPALDPKLIDQLRTWQSLNFPVRNSNTTGGGGTSGVPYPPATGGTKPPC